MLLLGFHFVNISELLAAMWNDKSQDRSEQNTCRWYTADGDQEPI